MSIDSIIISCNGCDYRYMEHFVPITIKCKIGDEVATYDHTTAWCNQCGTIRYIEYIPKLVELQHEYDRRVSPTPDTPAPKSFDCRFGSSKPLIRGRWYGRGIKELKNRITWRQKRSAPPHCLTCGTTDITLVDYERLNADVFIAKTFRHSCGGALVINLSNNPGIRYSFIKSVIWMDIEGNKLNDHEDE